MLHELDLCTSFVYPVYLIEHLSWYTDPDYHEIGLQAKFGLEHICNCDLCINYKPDNFCAWGISHHSLYSNLADAFFAGYLSDSPHEFLVELLEFVMSLVEQGEPPANVLQTCLPNLFGPTFGIKNHAVSCKLLEYGCLAVYSQHKWELVISSYCLISSTH